MGLQLERLRTRNPRQRVSRRPSSHSRQRPHDPERVPCPSGHQIHECGLDEATRNRQRLNCVSAVQFLASLGIKDFPVYGLATSGQYGHVSSTWFSSADIVRRFSLCAFMHSSHRASQVGDGRVRRRRGAPPAQATASGRLDRHDPGRDVRRRSSAREQAELAQTQQRQSAAPMSLSRPSPLPGSCGVRARHR